MSAKKFVNMPFSVRMITGLVLLVMILETPKYCEGRKHQLHLRDDARRLIHITSFGFFKGGYMEVKVNEIYLQPAVEQSKAKENNRIVGFTVDRTLKDGINPYPHDIQSTCALEPRQPQDESSSILFALDFDSKSVKVECSRILTSSVHVYKSTQSIPYSIQGVPKSRSDFRNIMTQPQRRKRNGTAEIMGINDYDLPFDNSTAEYSSNYSETDGLGILPSAAGGVNPVQTGESHSREGVADVPSANAPSGSPINDQSKTGVGVAKTEEKKAVEEVKLDDDLKSDDNPKLPHSSEENDADDFLPKGGFSDPAITCSGVNIPLNATVLPSGKTSYSFTFVVYIAGEDCEGLYNLYFHNCAKESDSRVTLNMSLVEKNLNKNYLSAGEMPLPALYFMMSVLFFIAGCFWMFILNKSKRETGVSVFKIHYLMGALVYLKSLSLFFHSVNYHFIQTEGAHVEGWAVLYYIAHLLKGALLFITILLIGTGYAFVKHLLSDKDKKIFMIVIPLQVLANVAQIIIEESEEGEVVHTTWQVIFISVDLLCCCAILFPVVWSIRHLQEASQTDGKAASNLRKLKLFRHFYIIVVCYIYFTRIIVQMLLKITVPFQYEWLDDMFREMTTFIFFVLTGYKFRPAVNNPYLELAHDSDDEEMDVPMTESGLTEGAVKRGFKPKKKTLKEIVLFDPNEEDTDDDEEVLLEKRREASHDLD